VKRPILALAAFAAAAMLVVSTPALAEQVAYNAMLSGSSQVPPNDSAGTGTVSATFDTESMMLTWTIEYSGLTGDATAAHFHGPATPEENAPPVVPLDSDLTSPIDGSATLTDQQAADLAAGLLYFNLHTVEYPDGEIRGQLMAGDASTLPAPASSEAGAATTSSEAGGEMNEESATSSEAPAM
jgi:hypothetical protein